MSSQQQVHALNELVSSLKKEVILLRDEVRVKDQMIISTSNMLHRANEELMQLRSREKKNSFVAGSDSNNSVAVTMGSELSSNTNLHQQISELNTKLEEKDKQMTDWRCKVKEAIKENKRKEKLAQDEILGLQNQIMELQTHNRDLQYLKRTRAMEKIDREVQTINFNSGNNNNNNNNSNGNNIINNFSNNNGNEYGISSPTAMMMMTGGQQSDFLGVAARIGSAGTAELQHWMKQVDRNNNNNSVSQSRALSLILTPPSRRGLSQNNNNNINKKFSIGSGNNTNLVMSPEATLPIALQQNNKKSSSDDSPENYHNNNNNNNTNLLLASANFAVTALNSPPPQIPEMSASELLNAPPIIVSIFYGTADGWSVDTKLRVEPGQTIADLIAITCDRVNERYGKKLEAASMCLRTHHPRAQRWVTIRDHRSVHSFAFFLRSATQSEAIKLQLEPLSAAELARRQSQSLVRESVARQLQEDDD